MPVLPTFTAQRGELPISGGRRATGEDLYSGGVGDLAATVGKAANTYVAQKEDTESRTALVASTEIRAKYAKALDEAALSGGDLEALKGQMNDELARVGQNFETKRGSSALELYTANSAIMFDQQANNIAVTRAAAVARLEGSKFLSSAGAMIQGNPLYLGVAERDAEAFGLTLRNVSPEKRAEIVNGLKKELNMAAAISSSRIDPEGTKTKLDKGEWDLSPEQRSTALNKADTEIRAKKAEAAYQRAQDEIEKRDADEKARDNLFKGIINGKTTRRDIMDNADIRPATREHLITFMEQRAKGMEVGERRSDPRAVRDLWMQINAPDGDPRKTYNADPIFAAVAAGRVNTSDANMLNNLVANQKDENNRSIGQRLGAQMSIVGRALSQDPQFTAQPALVAEIQLDYQARVLEKVAALRKKDANANPADVFDPASKDYVGSRAFIQQSIDASKHKAASTQPNRVNSQAEYDALPPGASYTDSNGQPAIKRAGRAAAGKIN